MAGFKALLLMNWILGGLREELDNGSAKHLPSIGGGV